MKYIHEKKECPNCGSDVDTIQQAENRTATCWCCDTEFNVDAVKSVTLPPELINVKRHGMGFEERGMHVGRPVYYMELGNDGGKPMRMGVLRDAAFKSGIEHVLLTGDPFSQAKIEEFVHFLSTSAMHVVLECNEKVMIPKVFHDVSWINLVPVVDKTLDHAKFASLMHAYNKYVQVICKVDSIGQFSEIKKVLADFLHFKNIFVLEPSKNVKKVLKQQVLEEKIGARVIERVA